MKASGLRTAKCDIKYFFGKEGRNFYDILTNAGFAFWPRQCWVRVGSNTTRVDHRVFVFTWPSEDGDRFDIEREDWGSPGPFRDEMFQLLHRQQGNKSPGPLLSLGRSFKSLSGVGQPHGQQEWFACMWLCWWLCCYTSMFRGSWIKLFWINMFYAVGRTICLVLLVMACDGTWTFEQPHLSVLKWFPRFRHISHFSRAACLLVE